jgi:hypothetical protein
MLSSDIESKFLDYVINSKSGIYYIHDKCLKELPSGFCLKITNSYINAHELLSSYTCAKLKLQYFIEWVTNNISEDGFWDMGQFVKDRIQFPLSNSWREPINRKVDCTVRIQRILLKLNATKAYPLSQRQELSRACGCRQ